MTRQESRIRRKKTVRKKISGTADRPRVSVFRSNKHIYVQAIDDVAGVTLVALADTKVKGDKTERSLSVGEQVGELLKKKKISSAVFDRNGYKYHGRVKAVAEGLRKSGIKV